MRMTGSMGALAGLLVVGGLTGGCGAAQQAPSATVKPSAKVTPRLARNPVRAHISFLAPAPGRHRLTAEHLDASGKPAAATTTVRFDVRHLPIATPPSSAPSAPASSSPAPVAPVPVAPSTGPSASPLSPVPAPPPPASHTSPSPSPHPSTGGGIPQGGGGDADGDNHGGPSDGDGNV